MRTTVVYVGDDGTERTVVHENCGVGMIYEDTHSLTIYPSQGDGRLGRLSVARYGGDQWRFVAIDKTDVVHITPTTQPEGEPMNASFGVRGIAAERRRQVEVEQWTADHDDLHTHDELIAAARCYLMEAVVMSSTAPPTGWPWEPEWWKPSPDPIRNLAKAGALIAAEMDRRHRESVRRSQDQTPPPVRADIADRWRKRDWPGAGATNPPEWYVRLWAEYLQTGEGQRRYPGGGFVGDTPVSPGLVGSEHAYCEHGTPTGYTCAACADEAEGRSLGAPPDHPIASWRGEKGAAGSSREPGRTGPGSQVHI